MVSDIEFTEEEQKILDHRLEMHRDYHYLFKETPQGKDVIKHLRDMFYLEYHGIHQQGNRPEDTSFLLGQRSVIAYILQVIDTTPEEIVDAEKQFKAEEDRG